MIQLISSNNLTFTKPKCNCGIGSKYSNTNNTTTNNKSKKVKKNTLSKKPKKI